MVRGCEAARLQGAVGERKRMVRKRGTDDNRRTGALDAVPREVCSAFVLGPKAQPRERLQVPRVLKRPPMVVHFERTLGGARGDDVTAWSGIRSWERECSSWKRAKEGEESERGRRKRRSIMTTTTRT